MNYWYIERVKISFLNKCQIDFCHERDETKNSYIL